MRWARYVALILEMRYASENVKERDPLQQEFSAFLSSTSNVVVLLLASEHRHKISTRTSTIKKNISKSTIRYQKSTGLRIPALDYVGV
jgi:hypothetical protein